MEETMKKLLTVLAGIGICVAFMGAIMPGGGGGGATPAGSSGDIQTNNGSGGLGSVTQATFQHTLSGTGFVKAAGGIVYYDSTNYETQSAYLNTYSTTNPSSFQLYNANLNQDATNTQTGLLNPTDWGYFNSAYINMITGTPWTAMGYLTGITTAQVQAALTENTLPDTVLVTAPLTASSTLNGANLSVSTVADTAFSDTGILYGVIAVHFDGGGTTPTTLPMTRCYVVPAACTIVGYTIWSDQTGSETVTVKRSTWSTSPSFTDLTGGANTVLSSAQYYQTLSPGGWTTSLNQFDIIQFSLTAATTITWCDVALEVKK
jgi:hypothetical protein